jgi:Leucine-rich repeat (LRR) protein
MEFGKLQSLVELNLSGCSQLGCLPDSILNLSQLKTFQLCGCHKLTNLPMEFGKLQSLVELDLSGCSQLGCLPHSILNLSRLKTFRLGVRQIDESTDEVRETSKLGGTGLIRMFPIGVFA